jgi:hypothetical protein
MLIERLHTSRRIFIGIVISAVMVLGFAGFAVFLLSAPSDRSAPIEKLVLPNGGGAINIASWETYENEEFGIAFQYPPDFRLETQHARPSDLGEAPLLTVQLTPSFRVAVIDQRNLYFHNFGCARYEFSVPMRAWLSADDCLFEEPHYELECPNSVVGQKRIASFRGEARDAGVMIAYDHVLTNRDYAIVFKSEVNRDTPHSEVALHDRVADTLLFIGEVQNVTPTCQSRDVGAPVLLIPLVVTPERHQSIAIDEGFELLFSESLPMNVGAVVFVSDGSSDVVFQKPIAELFEADRVDIPAFTSIFPESSYAHFHGEMELFIKFYELIDGRNIFISDELFHKRVPIEVVNTLSTMLSLSVNDAVAHEYAVRDGFTVLKRGGWNSDIVRVRAENVRNCQRSDSSNPRVQQVGYSPSDATSIHVDRNFSADSVFTLEVRCTAPDGSSLVRSLQFLTESEEETQKRLREGVPETPDDLPF